MLLCDSMTFYVIWLSQMYVTLYNCKQFLLSKERLHVTKSVGLRSHRMAHWRFDILYIYTKANWDFAMICKSTYNCHTCGRALDRYF